MTAAYAPGGIIPVCPAAITGNGAPTGRGVIGQPYFDVTTSPRTPYIYSGAEWILSEVSGGTGVFSSLAVTGTSTINTTGAAATSIGTGATGVVNIGNTTGGTIVTGPISVSGLSTLTGGINTAPVVVAAGASPLTANGRSGQVTFSGVSIAAGATQSFVIANTSIAAIGTVILYSMVGATTGAALNIESVTNIAGTSSTIVVENGTGATTSIANITFTFLVLN